MRLFASTTWSTPLGRMKSGFFFLEAKSSTPRQRHLSKLNFYHLLTQSTETKSDECLNWRKNNSCRFHIKIRRTKTLTSESTIVNYESTEFSKFGTGSPERCTMLRSNRIKFHDKRRDKYYQSFSTSDFSCKK